MRPDPFGGVDDASLEHGVDLGGGGEDRRGARPDDDLAGEVITKTHLQPFVVADGVDLLPEPSPHLRGKRRAGARHEVESGVGLLPKLEPVALVVPGCPALGVHAERNSIKPLDRGLLLPPVPGARSWTSATGPSAER